MPGGLANNKPHVVIFSDMATLDSWLNRKKGKPPDVAGKPPNAVATLSVQDDSYTGTNVTPEHAASS